MEGTKQAQRSMEHTLVLVLWSKCSRKALPVLSPLPWPRFITTIKFMFPCTSRVERTINKTTLFTLSKPTLNNWFAVLQDVTTTLCQFRFLLYIRILIASMHAHVSYICPKCSFVRYSLPWWGYSNCDSIFCIWSRCPTQPSECRLSRVTLLYLESIV